MAEKRCPRQEVPVPDLLAALTAYGLGGPGLLPRADEGPAGSQAARRSWLARCLRGSYAWSRRLLDTALHAARQRKGVS
jgi:hypothetical protein